MTIEKENRRHHPTAGHISNCSDRTAVHGWETVSRTLRHESAADGACSGCSARICAMTVSLSPKTSLPTSLQVGHTLSGCASCMWFLRASLLLVSYPHKQTWTRVGAAVTRLRIGSHQEGQRPVRV